MTIANCKECGKIFNKIVRPHCEVCAERMEEDFEKVREVVQLKGPLPINRLSQETGVQEKLILRFVNEGRLVDSGMGYPCERCKGSITQGKLCVACANELNKEVGKTLSGMPAFNNPPSNKPSRMYTK